MANYDNTRNVLTANINYGAYNEVGDGYYANSFYGTYDHFQRIGWFFDKIVSNLDDLNENCQDILTGRFVYVTEEDAIFMRDNNYTEDKPYYYYPFGNYQYIPSQGTMIAIGKIGYGKVFDSGSDIKYYIERYSVSNPSTPIEKIEVNANEIPEGIFPINSRYFEDAGDDNKWTWQTAKRNGVLCPCQVRKFYQDGELSYLQRIVYSEGDNDKVFKKRTILEIKTVIYNDTTNAIELTGFRFIGFATRKAKLILGEDGEYINVDFQKEIPYKIAATKNIQQMSAYYFPTKNNQHIFKQNNYQLYDSNEMNIFDKDIYEKDHGYDIIEGG